MIKIRADTRNAYLTAAETITSGSVGMEVAFTFSPEWDGLGRVAVFQGSGERVEVAVYGTGYAATIPPEVLAEPGGRLLIGVCGLDGKGKVVIPTIWVNAGPIKSGAEVDTDTEPTPSLVEQILAASTEAVDAANNAVSMATEADEASREAVEHADAALEAAQLLRQESAEAATAAESWAVGGTGSRAGEDSDNAKYYAGSAATSAERAEQVASEVGYVTFEINDAGHLLYYRTESVTDLDFKLDAEGRLLAVYG